MIFSLKYSFMTLVSAVLCLFFIPNILDTVYAEKRIYSIQVSAYKNLDKAMEMVDHLKGLGHNAFYRYETVKGKGKWYRIYIERYGSKREAEKEAKILKKLDLISDYSIRAIEGPVQSGSRDREYDAGVYYLHVSSFKQKSNAEKIVQRIQNHGYKAFLVAEKVSGESWFRVYIGEFDTEKEARKLGLELRKEGIISYFKTIAIDKNTLFPDDSDNPAK